jgi:primosomal protein N'
MDADTVSASNTHEMILERFQKERIPVLIGTQMVAKGLNLPDVTLVGALDGDLGLYNDSYRAAETTFNMLTQVVGRAGRGDTAGRAMIQTFLPNHSVITFAAKQDYAGFYDMEIGLRKQLHRPFQFLRSNIIRGRLPKILLKKANELRVRKSAFARKRRYGGGDIHPTAQDLLRFQNPRIPHGAKIPLALLDGVLIGKIREKMRAYVPRIGKIFAGRKKCRR